MDSNKQAKMSTPINGDQQIPIGVEVICSDGVGGKSTYVLINPVTEKVTHLVVATTKPHHLEVEVPIEKVAASSRDSIQLKCTLDELQHMDPFLQTQYVYEPMPMTGYNGGYATGTYMVWPYAAHEVMVNVPINEEQIPPGELAVRRGTRVEATNGAVGHVDEFVVNAGTGNITHLVMREGHLWGKKDVSIPVSAVKEIRDDTVYLKLDKQEIEALPTTPIHRREPVKPS